MKRFLSICLTLCILLAVFAIGVSAAGFADVSEADWFYNEVSYAYENGLMNGVGDDKFAPNGTMTRAMIVTVLHRLSGEEPAESPCAFSDVKPGSYYEKAVAWAAEQGVVNGYSATSFGPNDAITREQMAAILYRYASAYGYDTSAAADIFAYTDYEEISSYAVEAMQWANGMGLINGTSATTLSPKDNATRAQVAAILYRFCEQVANDGEDAKTYTVTFVLNYEDAEAYVTKKVKDGKTVGAPEAPAREGYEFLGWFTESESGEEYDFDNKITADLELYAHWEKTEQDQKPEGNPEEKPDAEPETTGSNVFLLTQATFETQKTVAVTLVLCGDVELCGFDMMLSYDSGKLALKDLNTKYDLSLVSSAKTGRISFNYAGVSNITSSKSVLTAVFDVIAEDGVPADITLTPVEVIKTDANGYDIVEADCSVLYHRTTTR